MEHDFLFEQSARNTKHYLTQSQHCIFFFIIEAKHIAYAKFDLGNIGFRFPQFDANN